MDERYHQQIEKVEAVHLKAGTNGGMLESIDLVEAQGVISSYFAQCLKLRMVELTLQKDGGKAGFSPRITEVVQGVIFVRGKR